jgi:dolichol kinase
MQAGERSGRRYRPVARGRLAAFLATVAVAATLLEAVGRRGSDNFLVPVGTALLLWGLGMVLPMG